MQENKDSNYRELQDEPGEGICILQTSQPRDLQAAPRIHHQDNTDIENEILALAAALQNRGLK